jgi:hypothetical protein
MVVAGALAIQAAAALGQPVVGADRACGAVVVIGFGIGFGAASLVKPTIWPTGRPWTPEESHWRSRAMSLP